MKLDEFVEQTLMDITNGVAKAQEKSQLYIAPGYVENEKITEVQLVKFDVAVTASTEGGGKISMFSIGELGGNLANETSQRISFEVPVYFQAPTERNKRHFTKK